MKCVICDDEIDAKSNFYAGSGIKKHAHAGCHNLAGQLKTSRDLCDELRESTGAYYIKLQKAKDLSEELWQHQLSFYRIVYKTADGEVMSKLKDEAKGIASELSVVFKVVHKLRELLCDGTPTSREVHQDAKS